jgi:hypothetical protein
MKKFKTRHLGFALAIFGVAFVANSAFAGMTPIGPSVPEPTSALLFTAGVAVAAISIRMIRRK